MFVRPRLWKSRSALQIRMAIGAAADAASLAGTGLGSFCVKQNIEAHDISIILQ